MRDHCSKTPLVTGAMASPSGGTLPDANNAVYYTDSLHATSFTAAISQRHALAACTDMVGSWLVIQRRTAISPCTTDPSTTEYCLISKRSIYLCRHSVRGQCWRCRHPAYRHYLARCCWRRGCGLCAAASGVIRKSSQCSPGNGSIAARPDRDGTTLVRFERGGLPSLVIKAFNATIYFVVSKNRPCNCNLRSLEYNRVCAWAVRLLEHRDRYRCLQ